MKINMQNELPKRKPTRLKTYNYSENGGYFITICTKNRQKILSTVGGGAHDAPKVSLTNMGKIVEKYIISTNNIKEITVDKYVIMPDHIHMILLVQNSGASKEDSPTVWGKCRKATKGDGFVEPPPTNQKISQAISTLKRFCNKEIGYNIFQRSFYDHVIRNEADYLEIYEYIETNPQRWGLSNKTSE